MKDYENYTDYQTTTGFGSPAGDYLESRINLSEELSLLKSSIFPLLMEGFSMEPVISDGDVLVIDKDFTVKNGDIVAVFVGDELLTRIYHEFPGQVELSAFNSETLYFYEPLELWGKVVKCIKKF